MIQLVIVIVWSLAPRCFQLEPTLTKLIVTHSKVISPQRVSISWPSFTDEPSIVRITSHATPFAFLIDVTLARLVGNVYVHAFKISTVAHSHAALIASAIVAYQSSQIAATASSSVARSSEASHV